MKLLKILIMVASDLSDRRSLGTIMNRKNYKGKPSSRKVFDFLLYLI